MIKVFLPFEKLYIFFFFFFLVLGSLQTSLLCTMEELAGGRWVFSLEYDQEKFSQADLVRYITGL